MITCIKTNSDNEHFRQLVKELDADLSIRDGDEHSFYHQFNKINQVFSRGSKKKMNFRGVKFVVHNL